ncbi:hypothetical protein G6F42_025778 [Rhizopus arrhizus]|nr:hypothetical protein G6F42_025778 [Rhizopus arrhizus]
MFKFKKIITKGNEAYIDKFMDSVSWIAERNEDQFIKYQEVNIMPTIPISHLDTSAVDIKHSESAYNQTVISPIFKSIARQLYTEYGTVWFPGEEKLNSLFDQLKLIHPDIDKRHGYNADSVLRVRSHSNLEVFIAEVSSRFMQTDKRSLITTNTLL